jgi:hypothetical protein
VCVNIIRGVILGKKNLKPSEIPSNTSKYQPLILNQYLAFYLLKLLRSGIAGKVMELS